MSTYFPIEKPKRRTVQGNVIILCNPPESSQFLVTLRKVEYGLIEGGRERVANIDRAAHECDSQSRDAQTAEATT